MNRYIPDDVKGIVWRKDGGRCVVCGSNKDLEYDHIIPHSKGGSNSLNNLQLLCKKHNRQKRDFIDAGFVMSKTIDKYGLNNNLGKYMFQDGYVVKRENPKIDIIGNFDNGIIDPSFWEGEYEKMHEEGRQMCLCGKWFKNSNEIDKEGHIDLAGMCSEECYWDLAMSHFNAYGLDILESLQRVLNKMKKYNIKYNPKQLLRKLFEDKKKGLEGVK